jgi:nicotinamidase-related amidase
MPGAISHNAALLLIDVQKAFDDQCWGNCYRPEADANIGRLLDAWRNTARPVVHVKHDSVEPNSPLGPDSAGNEIKSFAQPHYGERLFRKHVNSGFIGTDLEGYLRREGHDTLVIVGWTTDHCVSTTARMAGNLGFKTYVIADACAAHDRQSHTGTTIPAAAVHEAALASLHGEFATVCTTEEMLGWLARHPASASG